ncbi:hypothetical protein CPC16_000091 [Podila verticillata]|nr:hypothetical protein CPC16_000091 [Podila verticillata]
MKFTLLALATIAILAQQAQAKASTPIDGCLETFRVPEAPKEPGTDQLDYSQGGCYLLAEQKGVTFEDLLAWNKDLRRDCQNLDVGNDICVKGPNKDAPEAGQNTPIQPQAKTTPEMSKPQAVTTTNPVMADAKAKPQAASSMNANKPLAQSTRPLYPNIAKAVKQPPKAMASSPKGESVQSKVPSGTNEAQSYD